MEIGDDANSNSNYGSPIRELNLMDAVNLTTLPSSSSTSTCIETEEELKKAAKNSTHNIKSSVNSTNATDTSRSPSSPDVTCSSTTPSIPPHSYVSYHGRRYTVFEVTSSYFKFHLNVKCISLLR